MGKYLNNYVNIQFPQNGILQLQMIISYSASSLFFLHCSLVTLKVTSLLSVPSWISSPQSAWVYGRARGSPRVLITWRLSLYPYHQRASSSVGHSQILCLESVQASFICPFFFQLIVTHCARHCSECFMWLKTEYQSSKEERRNPTFLKQGSDYTVPPLLTVIACYLTTLSFN